MSGILGGLLGSFPSGPNLAFELISTVNAGGLGQVSFSSIPQTYKHLEVRIVARGTEASSGLGARVNDISSAGSYGTHLLYGSQDGISMSWDNTSTTYFLASFVARSDEPAGLFGSVIMTIPDYTSSTKNKTIRSIAGKNNGQFGDIVLRSHLVKATSPVTSLTFLKQSIGAGLFASGSRISLYGIKG